MATSPTSTLIGVIPAFMGEYRFLSNFWPSPIDVEGITFPTVEHAFQAVKTEHGSIRMAIARLSTPALAKQMGRQLRLRPDWHEKRDEFMLRLVRKKFRSHVELCDRLLATAPLTLVEGNTWGDTYWGVCQGIGQNRLGEILMQVRTEIQLSLS